MAKAGMTPGSRGRWLAPASDDADAGYTMSRNRVHGWLPVCWWFRSNSTLAPSALAVLRLMTTSYLVGACTGRSALENAIDIAGRAPVLVDVIRPVGDPSRRRRQS